MKEGERKSVSFEAEQIKERLQSVLQEFKEKGYLNRAKVIIDTPNGSIETSLEDSDGYFDIASVSKSVLATGVFELERQGVIELDSKAEPFDFTFQDALDYRIIANKESWDEFKKFLNETSPTKAEILEKLFSINIRKTEKSIYSNMPHLVLSLLLETIFPVERIYKEVLKVPFRDSCDGTKLFDPTARRLSELGINTSFGGVFVSADELSKIFKRFITDSFYREKLKEALRLYKKGPTYKNSFYVPGEDSDIFGSIDKPFVYKSGYTGAFVAVSSDLVVSCVNDLLEKNNWQNPGKRRDELSKKVLEAILAQGI